MRNHSTVDPPLYEVLGGAHNSDLPVSQNKGRCNVMNPMYYKKRMIIWFVS